MEKDFYRNTKVIVEYLKTMGINPNTIGYEYYLETIKRLSRENAGKFILLKNHRGTPDFYDDVLKEVIKEGVSIRDFSDKHKINEKEVEIVFLELLKVLKGWLSNDRYIEKQRTICQNLLVNDFYLFRHSKDNFLDEVHIRTKLLPILRGEGFGYTPIAAMMVRYFGTYKGKNEKNRSIDNMEKSNIRELLKSYNEIHKAFYDGTDIFETPRDELFVEPNQFVKRPLEFGSSEYPDFWIVRNSK